MTTTGGRVDAGGLAQDAVQVFALVRDLDPLARRPQVRQREVAALDPLHVRRLHLRDVVHEQERAEMVVHAGALQVLAGAQRPLLVQGLAPEPLMHGGALRPGAAPVVPRRRRRRHLLEVGEVDAVRDEARRPVGDGGTDQGIGLGDIVHRRAITPPPAWRLVVLARPVVRVLLGARERVGGLEAGRHRGVGAGEDLVVLDVERAQPALLPHGERHEIADLDQLRLAEVLVQARPELVVHRQVPGDRLRIGERGLLALVVARWSSRS